MKPIFDAHLDLAWSAIQWNRDLAAPLDEMRRAEAHMNDHPARGRGTVTLPELRKAGVAVCLGTVLVRAKPKVCPQGGFNRRDLDFRDQTLAYAMGQAHVAYYRQLERLGHIRLIRTARDLADHWEAWLTQYPENLNASAQPSTLNPQPSPPPLGVILAMEGADPIVNTAQADEWWAQGLRCVGMAHYGPAPYACGTGGQGPLTDAGRDLLREFARLGMIVDLTHCAEPGFFEVLDLFDGPVHASHNMCRALVPGDRQFSDDQIRRLIERDAVIGMAFDSWMLAPGWKTGVTPREAVSLETVADHVDHICQIAGNARHVGIGSDLDGGFGTEQSPHDLDSIADLQKLDAILTKRGYSNDDVAALFHANWLRFFTAALPQT